MDKIDKLKDREAIKVTRAADSLISQNGYTKEYKSDSKALLIEKDDKTSMINMKLLSSYNMMVGAGESVKIAEIRLVDWTGKKDIFDELSFYNKKNYKKLDKTFTFKYVEDKTVNVCIPIPDGSDKEFCEDRIVPDWENAVEFKKLKDLPHKDISIGIFTDTTFGEKVEWLPTIDGFDIYEWAAYDVTEIDVLEHDTIQGDYNSLVMIDSTHFMLAYGGNGSDGYIKTFSIDGSYDTITEIDELEYDIVFGYYNSLVKIDSTHFILASQGSNNDGFIRTFSIDGNYDITETDELEHDTSNGSNCSLVMIDSTHFALAYAGGSSVGYIKTFSIDGNYDITEIDKESFDLSYDNAQNSLVMIDSTHLIVAYRGTDWDGYIKTFSIDANADNITEIDVLEHDTDSGYYNSLVKIDSTHFMLAYTGTDWDGYIKTFSIDANADNITEIDVLEHDTDSANYNSLVMIDSTHFALAYTGTDWDGFIKIFSIDGSYDNITQISSLEHDTNWGDHNSLVKIDATHFILAYRGTDLDGFIKTFSMETSATGTNMQVNISDAWKDITKAQINIGDTWKEVTKAQVNVGDTWKTIF